MFAGVLLVVQPTFLKRLLQIDTGDSCHAEGIMNNASLSKGVVSNYSNLISENNTALENMTSHVDNGKSAGVLKTVQQKARDDIIGKTTLSIKLAPTQKNVTLKMNDVTAKNINAITENNKVTEKNNNVTTEYTSTTENENVTVEKTRVTTRNDNVITENKNGTTENNIPLEMHHDNECSKRWKSGMDIKISHFVGCLLTIVASLAASLLIIFSRKAPDVSAITMMAQTNLVTAIAAVFSTTVSGAWSIPAQPEPWLWVAGSTVLFVLVQVFFYLSLKYETASVIAMVRTADIPCVFILQVLFIHRIPNSLDLIGASVVMCTVLTYGAKRVYQQRSAVAAQSAGYRHIVDQCEDEMTERDNE
jgi:uncharacterized membrane protein